MNFNEELAVAGALELTDSELETAQGGVKGAHNKSDIPSDWEWIQNPFTGQWGWYWIPDEPNFYGGWGGRGGWGGWGGRGGRGGRGYDYHRTGGGHEHEHED